MKLLIILAALGLIYAPIGWVLEASGYNRAKRKRRPPHNNNNNSE